MFTLQLQMDNLVIMDAGFSLLLYVSMVIIMIFILNL